MAAGRRAPAQNVASTGRTQLDVEQRENRVALESSGLRLEGAWFRPAAADRAAVICHPHPEYGGDMDNSVVLGVVSALGRAGMATLRFNFRGTGASSGAFSGTMAETADALSAVTFVRREMGSASVSLVGYSFGAMVAALAAGEGAVERLALIALPVTMLDPGPLLGLSIPKLFVHGGRDQFCTAGALEDLIARIPGENELRVLPSADHFLLGSEDQVGREIARFVRKER